ncbi:MAG: recombinase family protein [bacterium]|nr:recombinase family protein [bacterium]
MSDGKIAEQHRGRKAILYIRQSSPNQVERNQESRRLQYGMQQRLRSLGWQEVEVVDDDLGRSGTSSSDRTGFQHMVAEVCLGQVGAVAAREVSRFARNNKDWHHLVELCRMFDTLLIDQDVVYDPRRANDRLLLGVKGSLSEYELDLLRVRAHEARHQKAARGELSIRLPAGYVHTDDGIEKDPDRRVQRALSLVFKKFLDLNSAHRTLRWFLEHDLELPVGEIGHGGDKIHWKRPSYRRVLQILTNPMYAGAYAYGKTTTLMDSRTGQPRKRTVSKPRNKWSVLIRDHHDAYVRWDLFEQIQATLSSNSYKHGSFGKGVVKRGPALLGGLLRCRRCGRRLRVAYCGRGDVPRYQCDRGQRDNGEPRCISFGGTGLHDRVSDEILRVVEPGAVEAAQSAADHAEESRDELISALELDVKEARYTADQARKRYEAVDPANRLVADELEARWNTALVRVDELKQRLELECKSRRPRAQFNQADFLELAEQLVEVWNDPKTDVRLKKRILRAVINEIMVDLDDNSNEVVLMINWAGGVHTELRVARRKRGDNGVRTSKDVLDAVGLLARVCSDEQIAGFLNKHGQRTRSGERWIKERVGALRYRNGIQSCRAQGKVSDRWMTLKSAAAHLGVAPATLRRAVERGELPAEHPLANGPWIFDRESVERVDRAMLLSTPQPPQQGAKPLPGQLALEYSDT